VRERVPIAHLGQDVQVHRLFRVQVQSSRKKPPIISLASAKGPSMSCVRPWRTSTRAASVRDFSDSTARNRPRDCSDSPKRCMRTYTSWPSASLRAARWPTGSSISSMQGMSVLPDGR
jgi:hypothetical protein